MWKRSRPGPSAGDTWPSDGMAANVGGCWILTHLYERGGNDDSSDYLFGLFEARLMGLRWGVMLAEVESM